MEAIFHMQYYMNTVSQKFKSELYMIYHMITAQNVVILGF